MIHNENHPDEPERSVAEWDQIHAQLRNRLHRMQNPPWWDWPSRAANRSLRLEKAYINDDVKARRWVAWSTPVRFAFALTVVMMVGHYTDYGDHRWLVLASACLGVFAAYFAIGPWQRASVYARAHQEGKLAGYVEVQELMAQARNGED